MAKWPACKGPDLHCLPLCLVHVEVLPSLSSRVVVEVEEEVEEEVKGGDRNVLHSPHLTIYF